MNSYLLESNDSLSLQKKVNEIIKENNFEEAIISNYSLNEQQLELPLEDLDTYSFLSEKKVIIINEIESLNKERQDKEKKDLEHLFKYLDNQNKDNLLIITSKKLNNTYKLTKDLKKKCNYILVEYTPDSIIKESLKDYKISKQDIEYLIELCDKDITKISNECEKLKMYCLNKNIITKEDIKELVVKKLGDSQNLTFDFARALIEKDKQKALKLYNDLLEYESEPISLVGLIASQLRVLLQIKTLENDGLRKNDIADKLGKKPFYISKQQELTRLYSSKEIGNLIKRLQEVDIKMKSTDLDKNMLIQMYIINS